VFELTRGAHRAGSYQPPAATPARDATRDAEGSSGAARRAARARPAAGGPLGCWAPSKQRGGSARRGRGSGKVEPECRPAVLGAASGGFCKDHITAAMRWPRPHARLAGAAARLVQHLQLRLGLRRVLLHALDGWWGGVLVIPLSRG